MQGSLPTYVSTRFLTNASKFFVPPCIHIVFFHHYTFGLEIETMFEWFLGLLFDPPEIDKIEKPTCFERLHPCAIQWKDSFLGVVAKHIKSLDCEGCEFLWGFPNIIMEEHILPCVKAIIEDILLSYDRNICFGTLASMLNVNRLWQVGTTRSLGYITMWLGKAKNF